MNLFLDPIYTLLWFTFIDKTVIIHEALASLYQYAVRKGLMNYDARVLSPIYVCPATEDQDHFLIVTYRLLYIWLQDHRSSLKAVRAALVRKRNEYESVYPPETRGYTSPIMRDYGMECLD